MTPVRHIPFVRRLSSEKNFAAFTSIVMLLASLAVVVPGMVAGGRTGGPGPDGAEDAPAVSSPPDDAAAGSSQALPGTNFTYPAGSSVVAMPGNQTDVQLRQAYKYIFNRIYTKGDVEWSASSFIPGMELPTSPYEVQAGPGSFIAMDGMAGDFNVTTAVSSYDVPAAYSLQPAKIALFAAQTTDFFGQLLTWEEGYFERIFKTYLWGNYFTTVNESNIAGGALANYDVLILPAIKKGYTSTLETALGSAGLSAISSFVHAGGMLYAQSDSCHVAEAAGLVPNGTVNTTVRISTPGTVVSMTANDTTSPLTWSWQTNNIYVLDDPLLSTNDTSAIVASYSSGLKNSSHNNTPAILHFRPGNGSVVLCNAHPSDKGDQYPVVLNAMLMAMSRRCDVRGEVVQHYSDLVDPDIIPAQEGDVSATVTTTFHNFWNVTINTINITEVVSSKFVVNQSTITPAATSVQVTLAGTNITWLTQAAQGSHEFSYQVLTLPNTTKHGTIPVSDCSAEYTDPLSGSNLTLERGQVTLRALLAARLNGDRDVELDGVYPLPAAGAYFDVALPLENKEDTLANNITVTDIVVTKSPLVDVTNQTVIPGAVNNTNNGTNNSVWIINEVFYYYDQYNQPLYPLPDKVENTTYNYTLWNNTNLTLPAVRLTWNYGSLQGYDYQEPAIRYGIRSHEQFNRSVSCLSYPVNGTVIMNCSGGTVFTNLGIHPVPYNEYLTHGVVTIPEAAGGEKSSVAWKDIWERDHDFRLRTSFYDIVYFTGGVGGGGGGGWKESHAVTTTTFELTVDGNRTKEFPIHEDAEVHYLIRTWNGYEVYNQSSYPWQMNLTMNETMIVHTIPTGVGYDLAYTGFVGDANTSLLKLYNTSTSTNIYYQQAIPGGGKARADIYAELSSYPWVHREGDFKISDGTRFVYHQQAAGPSRYEVFDSHVQAVFGIGNDISISKITAPAFISTYGDQLYHFIKVEDPYEPREFTEDPYIASFGFGEMSATTYVGGRQQDTLFHARVDPGEKTLVRIEVNNNLGYDLENVSLVPQAPQGWNVTADTFSESIPPLFYDFPFINRSEIWDAWKSVWYFWVTPPASVERGRTFEIPFQLVVNGTNASHIPSDFEVPPAVVGVKDTLGYVSAIFGTATQLDITDVIPNYVGVSDVRIANASGAASLEVQLATSAANPKIKNDTSVNASYYKLTQINYTVNGTLVDIDLPAYAQTIPWLEDGQERYTLYIIMKTNLTKTSGGIYLANYGPQGSYKDHFNKTIDIAGNSYTVACHGPSVSPFPPSIHNVTAPGVPGPAFFLTRTLNNTVMVKLTVHNDGDGIAEGMMLKAKVDVNATIDAASLPQGVTYQNGWLFWTLGDLAPGSGGVTYIKLWATPPPLTGPNSGPPDQYRLLEFTQNQFVHSFLQKVILTDPSPPLNAGIFATDLNVMKVRMDHPFAAVGHPMGLTARVKSDWQFSQTVTNIIVNFSVDGNYTDQGVIGELRPLENKPVTGTHTFLSAETHTLRAEIVGPNLTEFYDDNNMLEAPVDAFTPYTLFTEPDHITSQDTYTTSLAASTNQAGSSTMRLGRSAADGYMRTYVSFDLGGVPGTALVVDAELKLYLVSGGGFGASAHQVTTPWTEGGVAWSTGPAFAASAADAITLGSPAGYQSWDVTELVRSWVEGEEENYGFAVKAQSESTFQTADLYSADCDVAYYRPALLVTFADPWDKPDVPANLAADDPDDDRLRLTWDRVNQAFDYKLYKASASGGPYNLLGSTFTLMSPHGGDGRLDNYYYDDLMGGDPSAPAGLATTHTQGPGTIGVTWSPSTVPPSPTYYYRIQASNEDGNSNLPSSVIAPGQVTPEVDAYEVYRASSASGPWNKIGESDIPSYTDTGLGDNATWYYRLRARSTEGNQSAYSTPVMGRSNAPPVASGPLLAPGGRPATTSTLTASWSYHDHNGDSQDGTLVQWYRGGQHVSAYDGSNPLPASATSDGDVWRFTVTPRDGIGYGNPVDSGTVTINNRPTADSLSVAPANPETEDDLVASYTYSDADSDPETGTTVEWYRDSLHQAAYDGLLTVPASATSRGDVWQCRVIPHDGIEPGPLAATTDITIGNAPPVVLDLTIIPAEPRTGDNLRFTYTYFDSDGDSQGHIAIKWYRNGAPQDYQTGEVLASFDTVKGESWFVEVSASDGMGPGPVSVSQTVTILNTGAAATDLSITPSPAPSGLDVTGSYDYHDDDDDTQSGSEIQWYRDGTHVTELDGTLGVPSSMTSGGEDWHFTVRAGDGESLGQLMSSPATTINNPPEVTDAAISPDPAHNADILVLSFGYGDADGHPQAASRVTWYRNSEHAPGFDGAMEIPADSTSPGEMWVARIVVADPYDDSSEVQVQAVVANTPPEVRDVSVTPPRPSSTETLGVAYTYHDHEGDPEEGTAYRWFRDGAEVEELAGQDSVLPRHTAEGEVWHCAVTPGDGASMGAPVMSPTVTIYNGEPSVTGVAILPEGAVTTDELTLDYVFTDPEGDAQSGTTIVWYRDGLSLGYLDGARTVPPTETSRGQEWYVEVTPSDGGLTGLTVASPTITIGNSLPTATELAISPLRPVAGGTLEASYGYEDADGDLEADSVIRWFRDGAHVSQADGLTLLEGMDLAEGEVWHFEAQVSDGIATADPVVSAAVTVNHRPLITSASISPAEPSEGDELTVQYEFSDGDGDPLESVSIRWFRNGDHMPSLDDSETVPGDMVTDGDGWKAVLTPHDGVEQGDQAGTGDITVGSVSSGGAGSGKGDDGGAASLIIAAVIMAVLLLMLILLFTRRRRKAREDTYFEEDLPEFEPVDEMDDSFDGDDGDDTEEPDGDGGDGDMEPDAAFTPDPVACALCRELSDGGGDVCLSCGFPLDPAMELEQGCPHCGAAFPLVALTSPDCPSCGGDLGVVVDGVEGAGLPPAAAGGGSGGSIELGGSVSGELECPACHAYVSLSTLRTPDCPMCGSGLGVAMSAPKAGELELDGMDGWELPDQEAAGRMDDDMDDWSAPTIGLGDGFEDDDDWNDDKDDSEIKGETVEGLEEEEEELDKLFSVN